MTYKYTELPPKQPSPEGVGTIYWKNFNYFDSTKQGKEKSLGWYTFIYNAVQCTQECIRVVHDYIPIFKRKVQNIDH